MDCAKAILWTWGAHRAGDTLVYNRLSAPAITYFVCTTGWYALTGYGDSRNVHNPECIKTFFKKASDLFDHRRYGEAAKYCDMILSIDPNNIRALEEREFALIKAEQYGKMISVCSRILKDHPGNVHALSDMGLGLIMIKKPSKGDESLDRALAQDPEHIPTLWRKAMAQSNMGKYKQAIFWLDRALAINQHSSLAYKRKGDALSHLGNYDAALSFYDKSLAIRPDSTSTLKGKAHALHKLGRSDESLTCYENAWKADTSDRGAFFKFIRLLLETKKYEDVILYCDRVLSAEPGNADMLMMKGVALSKLGRNEIVDYRDAILDVAPWNMDVLWTSGAGSQITGYVDVSNYCSAILKDEPWNINILWKKAVALSQLDDNVYVASDGRVESRHETERAKGSMFGSHANPIKMPILIPDTNVLYTWCVRGVSAPRNATYMWRLPLRNNVCYVEYTVSAEMRRLLQNSSECSMWERMQSDILKTFESNMSDFFQLVSRYSKNRVEQVLDVRHFYADMVNHPEMRDTIERWHTKKRHNPIVKEKGAQALLKNNPDNNILAFAAFCARETGAPTMLLSRDIDFLYFAEQIWPRFNVKVAST